MKTRLLATFLTIITANYAGFVDAGAPLSCNVENQFTTIRGWMQDAFSVPANPESKEFDVFVGVILRHHGVVLGHGSGRSLEESARIAFQKLRRQNLFKRNEQISSTKEMIDAISIEIEVCNKLLASPNKYIDRFAYNFDYGNNGIAVRRGDQLDFRLPCELRLAPHKDAVAITESLCINVGMPPTIAFSHKIPIDANATLYTLPCHTFLQNGVHGKITPLIRGDELITLAPIDIGHLTSIADSLASHLIASTRGGSVIGGYQPELDMFTNMFATHFVQVLTAEALYKYGHVEGVLNANEANTAATAIAESIAIDVQTSQNIDFETASLLVVMYLQSNLEQSEEVQKLLFVCEQKVLDKANSIVRAEMIDTPAFVLALLCSATYEIERKNKEEKFELSSSLCAFCWKATTIQDRASLIPWIIDPMIALEQMQRGSFATPLSEFQSLARESQVHKNGVDKGGFQLQTRSRSVVDARGLRMLPMLSKLCNKRMENSTESFITLVHSLRFLEQLITSEERAMRFENPAMALGGVRTSTWDASMPTEATAMALLGVVDSIHVVNNILSFAE